MRIIQVARTDWLVIDEAYRPRHLIHYGPAVNRTTGETHLLYRVSKWALERRNRVIVAWLETYQEASEHCRTDIERPAFDAPFRDGYSSAISAEEQRRRWEGGQAARS
ncbi:hypothetical protein [Microbacterium arborescens]|uniref:hypothetical protein n=1 Tax=Microbacterium arborescens TaxID=33883 RepID=UPI0025A185DA|nr:hypothetical protein [Microbacterium arborescens]WJM17151.1 hypothetical protein QUC20_07585 [Microbacterium arborescens]